MVSSTVVSVCLVLLPVGVPAFLPQDSEPAVREEVMHHFYESNPTYVDKGPGVPFLEVATPRSQGLNVSVLKQTVQALAKRPETRSLLIIKNGYLVAEHYFHGANQHESRNVHSVSKSMLSALAGIALRKRHIKGLGQPLHELLGSSFPAPVSDVKKHITIEHLLTMTAGLAWVEDKTEKEVETQVNWVRAILSLDSVEQPGKTFCYSTGLSHLLSAAIAEGSQVSTRKFARKHLFKPLGITVEHWGSDPQGVHSGGYNLYLTPRELVRFGLLYLARGKYKGRQMIAPSWITKSFESHARIDDVCSYGYGWWLFEGQGHRLALAWGYGGQFIFLVPDQDLCVVITADTAQVHKALDPWPFFLKHLAPALKETKRGE